MMDLENYSYLLFLILVFSIIGVRKQENRFKLAFEEAEGNVLGLQEKTRIALSEFFRFANRTLVEMKHAKGELNIKKKLSPYQIIDGCISCGQCKAACPFPIIEEGYPYRIISDECIGCDLCNKACPVDTCRPIYNNATEISVYSDIGYGLYSVPRREAIRALTDIDLAKEILDHAKS